MLAFDSLTPATLICSGDFKKRLAILRIPAGIVAENKHICVVSGTWSSVQVISSKKPMFNISSASSSTHTFNSSSLRLFRRK